MVCIFQSHLTTFAFEMQIAIINGPNLNLLGERQPEIYGFQSFEAYLETLRLKFKDVTIHYFQSNIEGELIDQMHRLRNQPIGGIVLNAGGFSHTSVALADAIAAIHIPVISVHISNIYQREIERHKELMAQYVMGGIYGLGLDGYELAIRKILLS
jgi:3-dehydroquinate dehydratase-2